MENKFKSNGIFITFEGPDGSGKSSAAKMVVERLNKKYPGRIFLTREPGGNNNIIAEDIRAILLNKDEYNIADRAEALLFAASRNQHVNDFIKPHLLNGDIVICDRFVHSSLIYQGYARGIGIAEVFKINDFAIEGVYPDQTFFLMVPPEVGIERIKANKLREFNRLDKAPMDLHEKVFKGFRKIVAEGYVDLLWEKDKLPLVEPTIIDANQSIDKVVQDIIEKIEELLKEKNYGSKTA